MLNSNLGKLKKAKDIYVRELVGYKKALRPEYPSIMDIMNNLGLLYKQ